MLRYVNHVLSVGSVAPRLLSSFSPSGLGFDSCKSPQIYFDFADIFCQCWSEESRQRIENVDQTHLVLASGKPVLLKTKIK